MSLGTLIRENYLKAGASGLIRMGGAHRQTYLLARNVKIP
jgi:hypothetical protein